MKPIPYGKQSITQDDIDAVVATLTSDFLTQGPKVEEFERRFAEYIGCSYAVAVSNGTTALHLAALSLNVDSNSKIISTPITFVASANCIAYCGGRVEFADIDPETALLDINNVTELLKGKPKGYYQGIIPVSFAGYPVNLEQFKRVAEEFNLWIIEDAAHSPGAYFIDSNGHKQNSGNCAFSELAIFSFHPVKHIATGEGGMITTNRKDLYERLILLRTHGITKNPDLLKENHGGWYYEMQELGYNYRIPDMLTALGISQLKRAEEGIRRRREIASKYDEAFANISKIKLLNPHVGKGFDKIGHAYHLYIIQITDRKGLYDYLKQHNIYSQVHYIPVHTMPYYKSLGWKNGDFPESEKYYEQCLSLPMYPSMSDEEQAYVIEKVVEFYSK